MAKSSGLTSKVRRLREALGKEGRRITTRTGHRVLIGMQKGKGTPAKKGAEAFPEQHTMSARKIERVELIRGQGNVSEAYEAQFEGGGRAVWKPSDQPDRRLLGQWKNEIVSYEVAKHVGMDDLHPVTTTGTYQGRTGSLQMFAEGATVARVLRKQEAWDGRKDAERAVVFDTIMGNTDRHPGNWMVSPDGKLVLSDNGFTLTDPESTFGERGRQARGIRLGLWSDQIKSKDKIPETIKTAWTGKWPAIEQSMRAHQLSDGSITTTKARYDRVMQAKTFNDLFSTRDKVRLRVGWDEPWYPGGSTAATLTRPTMYTVKPGVKKTASGILRSSVKRRIRDVAERGLRGPSGGPVPPPLRKRRRPLTHTPPGG